MSLESDLVEFVKLIPAFSAPIAEALNVTMPHASILERLTYNQAVQDADQQPFVPYLYWTGPFRTDMGQCSTDRSGTQKQDYWFWCCHKSMTEAVQWAAAIRIAVIDYVNSHRPTYLPASRITAAIYIDSHPIEKDQTVIKAKEFSSRQAVVGFTFGVQSVP